VPRWLPRVLTHIRRLAGARRVHFTHKARFELMDLGLTRDDVVELMASLSPRDSGGRVLSDPLGEWMYVFRPLVWGAKLYLKVVLRHDCIVISCHEDETPAEGSADRDD